MIGASRTTCDDVPGDFDMGLCKFGAPRGIGIEADHPPSALDEVARDRASHDTKSDNADGLVHAFAPDDASSISTCGQRGPRQEC